jgi:hypothetical protein
MLAVRTHLAGVAGVDGDAGRLAAVCQVWKGVTSCIAEWQKYVLKELLDLCLYKPP